MELYIVGEIVSKGENKGEYAWVFCGVFDNKSLAEAACLDSNYFVGPAQLNTPYHELELWPGAYYPAMS